MRLTAAEMTKAANVTNMTALLCWSMILIKSNIGTGCVKSNLTLLCSSPRKLNVSLPVVTGKANLGSLLSAFELVQDLDEILVPRNDL